MHPLVPAAGPVTPNNVWRAWSFEPPVLILIGITTLLYVWGTWRAPHGAALSTRHWGQWTSFLGAMLSVAVALVSPLDALSAALFSAHMVQHLILTLVSAPLLILSDLPVAVVRALPRRWSRAMGQGLNRSAALSRAWHGISSPAGAWLSFAVPLWAWHSSALFEAALRNETIHALEHLLFVATGMLFWWVLLRRTTADHLHYGMAVVYLFITMLQSTILGALMTFTTRPWYAYYSPLVAPWGMTPLQDQQLAGLIMWMPGGLVFTSLTIAYFAAWYRALERRSSRMQARENVRAGGERD